MKRAMERIGYERVIAVPSGIPLADINWRPWAGGRKTVLYPSGSATERKGLEDFRIVAHSLAQEAAGVRFIAPNFPGDDVIPSMPYLPRQELLTLMRESYLVVLPIRWDEPFGLVAVEAMACGRPVVAYASGALPEIVLDGETGLLVPRGDTRALRAAVKSLLSDESRCAAMGVAARRRAETHFGVDRMTEGYLSVVREVCGPLPLRSGEN
ncbi:MAG: glycosyltransferase family 4 protein [Thermoplasmata archaeon]|nr:glycosyltransferase family 4 protein [Thermoplasmata archaeon]